MVSLSMGAAFDVTVKKIASNWIKLAVSVPAKSKKVIRYRVRVGH